MKLNADLSVIPKSTAKRALGLLREVQQLVLQDPLRVDMKLTALRKPLYPNPFSMRTYPACNTVACVAGWTNILSGQSLNEWGDIDIAGETLGLRPKEQHRLFCPGRLLGDNAAQTPEYARKVSAHIDRFIKRNMKTLRYKKV